MERALALAWQAAGGVSPRPPVGAIVVSSEGRVIGEGATEPRPGRHAEVVAIEQAGPQVRGSTLYCTLEPHSFEGVSPPCTRAIIDAGIVRVVAAIPDPNPAVNGDGISQLREAGVAVDLEQDAALVERAAEFVEGFAKHIRTRLPFVIAKFAMSLDGKIATASGDSQWITSATARQHSHGLRHRADALVTGIGTVLADDPRLTERDDRGEQTGRPRLRVVIDSDARMPSSVRLFDEPGDVLWVMGERSSPGFQRPNLSTLKIPSTADGLDVRLLVKELGRMDSCTVLVEAGGQLLGSFVDAGLVDRVDAYISPTIIGGNRAPGPVGGKGVDTLAEALRLQRVRYSQAGGDMLVTGYVDKT